MCHPPEAGDVKEVSLVKEGICIGSGRVGGRQGLLDVPNDLAFVEKMLYRRSVLFVEFAKSLIRFRCCLRQRLKIVRF